jgi:hypothetical protein
MLSTCCRSWATTIVPLGGGSGRRLVPLDGRNHVRREIRTCGHLGRINAAGRCLRCLVGARSNTTGHGCGRVGWLLRLMTQPGPATVVPTARPADGDDPVTGAVRRRARAIVAALAITQTAGYGTVYYAFAVFLTPLARDLHTSATAVTGALTAATYVASCAGAP